MKSGIYALVNTINGKIYIGSSQDLSKREQAHTAALKRGQPINAYLRNACIKYSADAFSFIIIEYCDISALEEREKFHIEKTHPSLCYNIRRDPYRHGSDFKMHTEEVREASRIRSKKKYDEDPNHPFKRKFVPDDIKKKISESNIKSYNTPEAKERVSKRQKAWANSDEGKQRLRDNAIRQFSKEGAIEVARNAAKKRNADMGKEKMMEISRKREQTKADRGASKYVVNLDYGSVYLSMWEAYRASGNWQDYRSFREQLNGKYPHKTRFRLIERAAQK